MVEETDLVLVLLDDLLLKRSCRRVIDAMDRAELTGGIAEIAEDEPFVVRLRQWLKERDDPRLFGTVTAAGKTFVSACVDFCAWLEERENRRQRRH